MSIDAELAKIAECRKTDSRAYFKDEAMQARERELSRRSRPSRPSGQTGRTTTSGSVA